MRNICLCAHILDLGSKFPDSKAPRYYNGMETIIFPSNVITKMHTFHWSTVITVQTGFHTVMYDI